MTSQQRVALRRIHETGSVEGIAPLVVLNLNRCQWLWLNAATGRWSLTWLGRQAAGIKP